MTPRWNRRRTTGACMATRWRAPWWCAAVKAGLEPEEERRQHPRTDLIPFESEHKFMATLHHAHDGSGHASISRARRNRYWRVAPSARARRARTADGCRELAATGGGAGEPGQRVLAVACKPAHDHQQELDFDDVEEGLVLLGLFGLIDPPREEAIEAVAECRTAGIRVKMITGDHAGTARAIAAQLDLENSAEAITGHDLDQMDDAALGQARARSGRIRARQSGAQAAAGHAACRRRALSSP